MLDSQTFGEHFKRMEQWFKQSGLNSKHIEQIYNAIKYMSNKAWIGVVDALIEDRRPIASAWPTIGEIRTAYDKYLKDNPTDAPTIDYNPDDDYRYPMSKLWGGFHLLEKTDSEADFERYANRVRMPKADRQRVLCKWRHCYKVKATPNEGRPRYELSERAGPSRDVQGTVSLGPMDGCGEI